MGGSLTRRPKGVEIKKLLIGPIATVLFLLSGMPHAFAAITTFHIGAPLVACVNTEVTFQVNVHSDAGLVWIGVTIVWGDLSTNSPVTLPNGRVAQALHTYGQVGTYNWSASANDGTNPTFSRDSGSIRIINCNGQIANPVKVVPIDPTSDDIVDAGTSVGAWVRVAVSMLPTSTSTTRVDWGDGGVDEVSVPAGSGVATFDLRHLYPVEVAVHTPEPEWGVLANVSETGAFDTAVIQHFCA